MILFVEFIVIIYEKSIVILPMRKVGMKNMELTCKSLTPSADLIILKLQYKGIAIYLKMSLIK